MTRPFPIAVKSLITRTMTTSSLMTVTALAITCIFFYDRFTFSIATGWGISAISFLLLSITVTNALLGNRTRTIIIASIGLFQLCIIGTGLFMLIMNGLITTPPFLIGFTSIVVALIFEGVRLSVKGIEKPGQ